MRLTQSAVDRAAVKAKPYRITDTGGTHLSLRVYPSGIKTYFFRGADKRDGKIKDYRIGDAVNLTLKEARQKAYQKQHDLENAKDTPDRLTMQEAVDGYMRSPAYIGIRPRTQEMYSSLIENHLLPRFRHWDVNDIRRRDIIEWIETLYDASTGAGIGTARNAKVVMSVVFSWLEDREYVEYNIVRSVKHVKPVNIRTRVLLDDEIKALWERLFDGSHKYDLGAAAIMVLLAAQRVTETSEMMIEHLDLDRNVWTIPASLTKSNREHVVPLTPFMLEIMKPSIARRKSGRVFNVHRNGVTNILLAMRDDPRFRGKFSSHDLRRTFATRIHEVKKGVADDIVRRVINHVTGSSGAMRHYNHYAYTDEKRELLEAWSSHIESLLA